MIRHVVFFRFKETASEHDRQAMAEGLLSLPGKIGDIAAWSQGFNAVPSDRNYDFCLIGDFATPGALQVYQDHPAHQDVVARLIKPIVASVAAVDFPS